MFKHILIPISSEFYSQDILERSVTLAKRLNSKLHLLYIIEEKALLKGDERVDSYRTTYERTALKQIMVNEQKKTADTVVFDSVKKYLKNKGMIIDETIVEGEYSDVIAQEVQKNKYDLVLMGFDKECLLKYRLFDHITIPVWVVAKSGEKTILAVCSNLAPNQKVPEISIALSKFFNWTLQFLYVVDTKDTVEVDTNLHRSDKKSTDELMVNAQLFSKEMQQQGYSTAIVTGSLEKETAKAAQRYDSTLVVVGREQKKPHMLNIHGKSTKRKIAENCDYSVLFVN